MTALNIKISTRDPAGNMQVVEIDTSRLAQAPGIQHFDAAPPAPGASRFVKLFDSNGVHVATRDTRTGLEYTDAGSTKEMTADEAIAAAAKVDVLGGGWQLATSREVDPIIDRTRHDPAVDPEYFPWIKPNWYWLRDNDGRCAWSSAFAWRVGFDYGGVFSHHRGLRSGFALAVRAASQ